MRGHLPIIGYLNPDVDFRGVMEVKRENMSGFIFA